MPVARRPQSCAGLLRSLPAAFALALALTMATGGASASIAADDHAAVCRCGMGCRPEACCCRPKKPAPPPEAEPESAAPLAEAPEPTPGPCLGAAPCGEDVAAPVKAATTFSGRALLGELDRRSPASESDRLPPPTSDGAPSSSSSRLDRPPKADPSA